MRSVDAATKVIMQDQQYRVIRPRGVRGGGVQEKQRQKPEVAKQQLM